MVVDTRSGTAVAVGRGIVEQNAWEQIKAILASKMTPQAYQNWVMRTELDGQDNGCLRVLVPDQVTKDFLEQEYSEEVRGSIRELKLPVRDVVYLSASGRVTVSESAAAEPVFASASGQLHPRFKFDNFVVGSCNQFAHAAARAVASFPGRSYNPLFLYGGVGMGKTNLMHAIGRALLDDFPSMRTFHE
jgi:chromosomal replication initiator protein